MKLVCIIARSLSSNFTNTILLHRTAHFSTSSSTSTSPKPNLSPSRPQSGNGFRDHTSSAQESKPSERVSALVDEISDLNLLEVSDFDRDSEEDDEYQRGSDDGYDECGDDLQGCGCEGRWAATGKAAEEEEKAEKTAFDLKLEGGFEAGVKIKSIKEVRACTELGLEVK